MSGLFAFVGRWIEGRRMKFAEEEAADAARWEKLKTEHDAEEAAYKRSFRTWEQLAPGVKRLRVPHGGWIYDIEGAGSRKGQIVHIVPPPKFQRAPGEILDRWHGMGMG